jgi:hypothetical protein
VRFIPKPGSQAEGQGQSLMTWNTGELSRRIVSGLPVIHSQSLANLPTSRDFGGIGILRKAENGSGPHSQASVPSSEIKNTLNCVRSWGAEPTSRST